MKQKKGWKVFFLSLLMCLTFSSGAWAAEGDPVKIERVKLKLESQLTKTGEVKVTNGKRLHSYRLRGHQRCGC